MFRDRYAVAVTGSLQNVYASPSALHCRYSIVAGRDWQLVAGMDAAGTQTSRSTTSDCGRVFSFGAPVQATFLKTTKGPLGWPSLVLECYSPGGGGRDVSRGYGVIRIPMESGTHRLRVPLFRPVAEANQSFIGRIAGVTPEYTNPRALGRCLSRDHTFTRSDGQYAEVELHVSIG